MPTNHRRRFLFIFMVASMYSKGVQSQSVTLAAVGDILLQQGGRWLYPIIGYKVTNQFSAGATLTYQYYNYPDNNYSVTQYGISPFVRYNFGQMFVYSEYMILNSPTYDPNTPRKVYNRWLMGIGYSMPLGKRGALNAMGLYDVLYKTSDRVFNSPWVFRVFFSF